MSSGKSKYVAVSVDGVALVHLPGNEMGGDYYTLCGLDGNDPAIGMVTVEVPAGALVNCAMCYQLFKACRKFKESDFSKDKKTI